MLYLLIAVLCLIFMGICIHISNKVENGAIIKYQFWISVSVVFFYMAMVSGLCWLNKDVGVFMALIFGIAMPISLFWFNWRPILLDWWVSKKREKRPAAVLLEVRDILQEEGRWRVIFRMYYEKYVLPEWEEWFFYYCDEENLGHFEVGKLYLVVLPADMREVFPEDPETMMHYKGHPMGNLSGQVIDEFYKFDELDQRLQRDWKLS